MLHWVAVHSLAIAALLCFIGPLFMLVAVSLMTPEESLSGHLLPEHPQWHNFVDVMRRAGVLRWWFNTLLYAGAATVATVVSSAPVAYALARFDFPGRRAALLLLLTGMMLPPQVTVVPMYILWAKQFHLAGTLWPLIVPLLFGDAFSIFLLRQFIIAVPRDHIDAARVDGCGELRTMLRVVLPMVKPALAAVALLQFFLRWNDYFGPQVYVATNPKWWTLSYGLQTFQASEHVEWNLLTAVNLLVTAPVVLVFFFAQRVFIQGVTLPAAR
ncbi:carbohydrate ABC transporter permease [Catenulispora yoronensis]|uniref:Carbohydrate ABC transporter permease n=2 Tax=Catenulispora yoronensis TaxID=450799 RepID=A0ABN2UIS4_9ACTN